MNNSPYVYNRLDLASNIADGLIGNGLVSYRSGLFLTAPRRQGKTTFLKNDLIPECIKRGWHCVYIDLWSNRKADPAELIISAITKELADNQHKAIKAAKSLGISKFQFMKSVEWDLNNKNLPAGVTLSDAIELLHFTTNKLIILIIDEAQHALMSEDGMNAMFALKAARDHLTEINGKNGLRLVFTGSSRDKLAQLVVSKGQPFFGSSVTTFPALDERYTNEFTDWVNSKLAADNQIHHVDVAKAFKMVGHRPEMLLTVISRIAISIGEGSNLGKMIQDDAQALRNSLWDDYDSEFNALTPIQKSVLESLILSTQNNTSYSPYSEANFTVVADILKSYKSKTKANQTNIQAALNVLRAKDLIWKSSRGSYALEDSGFIEWFKSK